MQKSCNECPFVKRANGSWRGYLSAYKDGMELHQLVLNDAKFLCHKDKVDICRGFALYMNKIVKQSKLPATQMMQELAYLVDGEESLGSFDGSKIQQWHKLDRDEMDALVLKAIG